MAGDTSTMVRGWLARIGQSDGDALNELLTHYQRRLTTLTRSMLKGYPEVGRMDESADVLQNALIRLDRALRTLAHERGSDPGFRERDFLRLAALQIRRELIDLSRRYRGVAAQAQGRVGDGTPEGTPYEPAASSTWAVDRLAEWTEFHERVEGLPPKAQEVFHLLWYQGLTQQEAAAILGVDVRTVKSRWQEARIELREAVRGRLPGS